jgi:Icc-related predicted phosphoesterase
MKILLMADLHSNTRWYRWLLRAATRFDLVCIAGDLLDLFGQLAPAQQAREAQKFLRRLAEKTAVAVCSGNHDWLGQTLVPPRGPVERWLVELDDVPNIVSDGRSRIVGDLVVTTVPFYCLPQFKRVWLDQGRTMRSERRFKWLVLHHEPPALGYPAPADAKDAAALIGGYQPDYWLCGHFHQLPYRMRGRWTHLLGKTLVFTPGQLPGAKWPNHIELNLTPGKAYWRTTKTKLDRSEEDFFRWPRKFHR